MRLTGGKSMPPPLDDRNMGSAVGAIPERGNGKREQGKWLRSDLLLTIRNTAYDTAIYGGILCECVSYVIISVDP